MRVYACLSGRHHDTRQNRAGRWPTGVWSTNRPLSWYANRELDISIEDPATVYQLAARFLND